MPKTTSHVTPGPLSREVRLAMIEGLLTQDQICERLEISVGYLRSLLNGYRDWGGLPVEKLYTLAELLGLDRRQISVRAGRAPLSEFIDTDLDTHPDQAVNAAWQAMQRDALVGTLLEDGQAEWMALPRPARIRELAMWAEILHLRARLAQATEKVNDAK